MKPKSICIFLIGLQIIFKPFYIFAFPYGQSEVPVIANILSVILVVYGVVLLVINWIKNLDLKHFLIYFIVDTLFTSFNIILCLKLNITRLALVEQGVTGSIPGLVINVVLIVLILMNIKRENKASELLEK